MVKDAGVKRVRKQSENAGVKNVERKWTRKEK